MRVYSFLACVLLLSTSVSADEPLPGPSLDLPVDVDGDGVSSYSDRWFFNYWLELGGDIVEATFSADVLDSGILDMTLFFGSSESVLAPSFVVPMGFGAPAAGGGGGAGGNCPLTAEVEHPSSMTLFPIGCLFDLDGILFFDFDSPSGFDMDDESLRLYASRNGGTGGGSVSRLLMPTLNVGTIPMCDDDPGTPLPPCEDFSEGTAAFPAEDIAIRKTPTAGYGTSPCTGDEWHVVNTWTDLDQICRSSFADADDASCSNCPEAKGEQYIGAPDLTPTPGDVAFDQPFAIDVVRDVGMTDPELTKPYWGWQVDDFIFSDYAVIFSGSAVRAVRFRRGYSGVPGIPCGGTPPDPNTEVVTAASIFDVDHDCDGATPPVEVERVSALALGELGAVQDFGDYFGIYYIADLVTGDQVVRRLIWDDSVPTNPVLLDECVADLPSGSNARTIEFDRSQLASGEWAGTGDLFVSEEAGRIWRVSPAANPADPPVRTDFGSGFVVPNGIAFHPSGVMLVSHYPGTFLGNVIVVDGWRSMFNRGDANVDGSINLPDGVRILDYLNGGAEPPCLDAADVNDDSNIDAGDAVYLFNYLFIPGSPPPDAPFRTDPSSNWCDDIATSIDPTVDLLGCRSYSAGCEIVWE